MIYSYRITSEAEFMSKINEIEESFCKHRKDEYNALGIKIPPDEVDFRPNMGFGNLKIVIDDLHKEVVKSETLARKFQSIRHSGIELLFVTQSFKNTNMHDLIKENFTYVILFKLSQNKVTVRSFLADLSLVSSTARAKQESRSSLEYIFTRMVQRNDSVLTFAEDDTCYSYIGIPKRGCKKVSDVRTAIADPNRQVCFQEIDCNSVKILFSKREKPLNYDNRFALSKMEVLTEKEQHIFLRHKGSSKDENETDSNDDDGDGEDVHRRKGAENSADNDECDHNKDRQSPIFQHERNNKKNRFDNDSSTNDSERINKRRKRPEVLTSESESDSDSDPGREEVDSMFYIPPACKERILNKKKRFRGNKQHSTHDSDRRSHVSRRFAEKTNERRKRAKSTHADDESTDEPRFKRSAVNSIKLRNSNSSNNVGTNNGGSFVGNKNNALKHQHHHRRQSAENLRKENDRIGASKPQTGAFLSDNR